MLVKKLNDKRWVDLYTTRNSDEAIDVCYFLEDRGIQAKILSFDKSSRLAVDISSKPNNATITPNVQFYTDPNVIRVTIQVMKKDYMLAKKTVERFTRRTL